MGTPREPRKNSERWVTGAVGVLFIGIAMAIVYASASDYTFVVIVTAIVIGGLGADALISAVRNRRSILSRGGQLHVFADADARIESSPGIRVIRLPEHYGPLSPILHVVPLQLLAYHAAAVRGTDVDTPRNLAKSVTAV